jgi:hypothetical protein
MAGKSQVVQIVRALHATGGFAGRLNSRHKQGDQGANNGDDDEQLDEGKAGPERSTWEAVHFRKPPRGEDEA